MTASQSGKLKTDCKKDFGFSRAWGGGGASMTVPSLSISGFDVLTLGDGTF